MGRNWPPIIFLLLATSLTCGQSNTQSVGTGVIAGTVLNEQGQQVNSANICISVTSAGLKTIICSAGTVKDGRFRIENTFDTS